MAGRNITAPSLRLLIATGTPSARSVSLSQCLKTSIHFPERQNHRWSLRRNSPEHSKGFANTPAFFQIAFPQGIHRGSAPRRGIRRFPRGKGGECASADLSHLRQARFAVENSSQPARPQVLAVRREGSVRDESRR